MKRKILSLLVVVMLFGSVISGCTTKEEPYPNEPVKVIVPWGVGGGVDVIARKFAEVGTEYLGQPIVVENHTGASGTIAMTDTLTAEADGYTMVVSNGPLFSLTPSFVPVTYEGDDFTPLFGVRQVPFVMLTNPSVSGIENFEDLVEYGKVNGIKYAVSGGPGNDQYTMCATVFKKLGIDAEPIVTDGQAKSINDIVGGHVDVAIATPPTYYDHQKAGNVKGIAALTPEAIVTEFGMVESVNNMGVDAEFLGMDYFAIRSDVPEEIREKLLDVIKKTYADEEFQAYMNELGFVIWEADEDEISDLINQQIEAMKEYIDLIK